MSPAQRRKPMAQVHAESQLKITAARVQTLEGMVQALELRNASFEQENDRLRATVLAAMRAMAPAAELAASWRRPREGA